MKKSFEYCVRGVIMKGGEILACKHKQKNFYYFPGGHVDFGENAEKALIRELKEEVDLSVKKISFIGAIENVFRDRHDKKIVHEINLIFEVDVKEAKDKSMEDHLDFFFLNQKEFSRKKVLPLVMQKNVIKWLKDKKIFWTSNIEI